LEERLACLALSLLPEMDGRALRRLKGHFVSARAAWENLGELPPSLAGGESPAARLAAWVAARDAMRPAEEMERLASEGVSVLARGDAGYPAALARIFDPPEILFLRGETMPGERAIAIVGARRASSHGRHLAEELAAGLAESGVGIVSGAAYGIDAASHRGALKAGGPTFAVLAHGGDHVYPSDHRELYRSISGSGALITEYPPGTPPVAWHFPERNRIISGLSAGVVVVEAGDRSGALITVDYAMEEGREVFAVPGSLANPLTRGPHRLIQQGARLVTCAEDILEELNWDEPVAPCLPGLEEEAGRGRGRHPSRGGIEPGESALLGLFEGEPLPHEALLNGFTGEVGEFYLALAGLLMKGFIREEAGSRYVKVHH
jgi:DNA processing protein